MDMESNSVKMVRLNSGEEILCKVNPLPDDCVEITDPLILIPTQQKSLALAPWLPYTNAKEEGVVISTDRIMFTVSPHPELAKEYLSAISGLVIPSTADTAAVVGTIGPQNLSE